MVGMLMLSGCSSTGLSGLFKKKPRTLVEVRGFRVQILATPTRTEADLAVEEVLNWWDGLSEAGKDGQADPLDVEIVWLQPYYRVRIGNFVEDGEAQRMLRVLEPQYPEAFIVPDNVWVLSTSR